MLIEFHSMAGYVFRQMKEKVRGSKAASAAWFILLCLFILGFQFYTMNLTLLSTVSKANNATTTMSSPSTSATYPLRISQDAIPEKPRVEIITKINQDHHRLERVRVQLPQSSPISCNRTYLRYDLCSVNGPTVLDPTSCTFFTVGPSSTVQVEKIKPYPRKYEAYVMAQIKELTAIAGQPSPPCKIQHEAPALVFSAGGYTGNFFHDFNDGIIPLYITVSSIFQDRDLTIVVSEGSDWWLDKYADLLKQFSKHPIITLEKGNAAHCFPSATLGLISHGFMTIDQTLLPSSKNFMHFRTLLDKAYGARSPISYNPLRRPRLVLTSRSVHVGRSIINQEEVVQAMKEVGFDVIVFVPKQDTPLHESYALINSSHAMVGVHGAGLTHALFLRPRAVLIQVVPIGVDWAAGVFFGRVSKGLDLKYFEYKIGVEESSLVEKYGKDNLLLKDPYALQKTGWPREIMDIYLKEQNVKLDLVKFKKSLKSAYRMANKLLYREG